MRIEDPQKQQEAIPEGLYNAKLMFIGIALHLELGGNKDNVQRVLNAVQAGTVTVKIWNCTEMKYSVKLLGNLESGVSGHLEA